MALPLAVLALPLAVPALPPAVLALPPAVPALPPPLLPLALPGAASTLSAMPPAGAVLWSGRSVRSVEFAGNQALSALALARASAPPLERPWTGATLAAVSGRVLDAYRRAGYLEARIASVRAGPREGDTTRIVLVIEEGAAVPVGEVEVRGASLFTEAEILELLGLARGRPFVLERFEAGVERLLERYENAGRPFAAVEPRAVSWTPAVSMIIEIREGMLITVGRVEVRGNTVTRSAVVERLAGLRTGVPFVQTDLERARARLLRSGLFAGVEPLQLAQDADRSRGVVLIQVREGDPNRVVGVAGYSGAEQGLTGLFDLELGNILGSGRRSHVRWEGRGNGVSLFGLDYAEPWILGSPLGLDVRLGRTVQDTLYTLSNLALVTDLELSPDWRAGLGWERESTVQALGEVVHTTRDALLLRSRFDSRDSRFNPSRGLLVSLELRLARKRLRPRDPAQPSERIGARTVAVVGERPQAWGRRHVTLARARAQMIFSDEETIPDYELYPLGGASSLRGYREEQFRGSRIGLATLEHRYLLDADGSRIIGFTDIGLISTADSRLAPDGPSFDVKVGYGVGLRLATRVGLVGVDYGLGEGDGPLDGKVHFLLAAAF